MAKSRRGRGEGSFEQLPSGRWRCVVSAVINGERIKQSKTFDTKKEAQDWRDSLKGKVAKAGTVSDWLDQWLALIKPDVANKTYEHDRHRVKRWLKPRLGNVKLRDLTGLKVKQMLSDMHTEGHSDSERQKAGAVLRKALNAAVSHGQLAITPMAMVKLPTPKREEKRSLTPDQILVFLEATGKQEHIYRVWLDAGLRPAELMALHWEDFDLEKGTVSIKRALDGMTNKPKEPKTKKSRRTLPLAPSTIVALLVARPSSGGLFLPTPSGEYWWASNFNEHVFSAIRKKAAIPWMQPYTFRHTMATLLIRSGIPIKVVSERLGHEDIATTLRTYAHVLEGDQSKAAMGMELLLNPPQKTAAI